MKTIDLTREILSLGELLDSAGRENVILRTADGREFLLAEMDDFEREVGLVRQNQELMELLEQRSRAERTYTLDQAREALGLQD